MARLKVSSLLALVAGIGLMYLLLFWVAGRLIFVPSRYPAGQWSEQQALEVEDVWLTARDGVRIHGWITRPRTSGKLMTLFLHGNAGNISDRGYRIRAMQEAGSGVLMIDYRGFGRSEGAPSEEGVYADADAGYDYLMRRGIPSERLVLHGESLGTAVAVDLAARRPCGGLILEAPFPSIRAVAGRILPLIGPTVVSGFETARKIPETRQPLLIIHGEADSLIPIKMGQEVFDAAPQPKDFWRLPEAGHNDIVESAGPDYVARLRDFYSKVTDGGDTRRAIEQPLAR